MIGDRLTTDMVFGRNNGLKTLFVQSGIGTYSDMLSFVNSTDLEDQLCVPDFYLKSLNDLNKYLWYFALLFIYYLVVLVAPLAVFQ